MTKKGTERTTRYITWSPLSFSFFLLFEVLSPSTESSNCYSLEHLSLELARRLSDPIQAGQVRRQTLKISLYVLSVPLLFKVTVSIRAVDFCEVMDKSSAIVNENHHHSFSSSASQRHVSYRSSLFFFMYTSFFFFFFFLILDWNLWYGFSFLIGLNRNDQRLA